KRGLLLLGVRLGAGRLVGCLLVGGLLVLGRWLGLRLGGLRRRRGGLGLGLGFRLGIGHRGQRRRLGLGRRHEAHGRLGIGGCRQRAKRTALLVGWGKSPGGRCGGGLERRRRRAGGGARWRGGRRRCSSLGFSLGLALGEL